jgi:hypothetical protein
MKNIKIGVIAVLSVVAVLFVFGGCTTKTVTTTESVTQPAQTVTVTAQPTTITKTVTTTVTSGPTTTPTTSKATTPTTSKTTTPTTTSGVAIVYDRGPGLSVVVEGEEATVTSTGVVVTGRLAQYDMGTYWITLLAEFKDAAGTVLGEVDMGSWRLEQYGYNPWDFEITFTTADPSKVATCVLHVNEKTE